MALWYPTTMDVNEDHKMAKNVSDHSHYHGRLTKHIKSVQDPRGSCEALLHTSSVPWSCSRSPRTSSPREGWGHTFVPKGKEKS